MQTDRGWAWVVLAASMGGNLLVGVLCYFVGVIHTGLLHQFHASVTTTAWVGALYSSNISLASPLASVLINHYGCRVCCVLGGFLCFAGFTASAFVTTMPLLFVTYGLMAGLGLGLCLSPTIVTVGFYFDKYRSLAAGMSMSSTAVGILGGSLIAQTLIDEYSVSGAFLLIAAISLHYCFCGMFYRPTPFELNESKIVETDQNDADREWEMKGSRISLALHGVEIKSVSLSSSHGNEQLPRPGYGSVTSLLRKAQLNGREKSLENGSLAGSMQSGEVFVRHRTSNPALVHGEDAPSNAHYKGLGMNNKGDRNHISFEKLNTSSHCDLDADCDRNHQIPEIIISSDDQEVQGKSHSMIDNSHSNKAKKNGTVTNGHQVLSKTRNDVTDPDDDTGCRVPHHTEISTDHDYMCSLTSQEVTKSPGKLGGHRNDKMKRLKTADSYWQVLTNKAFMFHCASTLASSLHVAGVYLHLPEYVHTKGTSPTQGAALFIAVGVMSLVSRLAAGFATMEPKIDPLTLNLGMMGLCGISTIFFPYYSDTYSGQLVFAGLFGLYTGGQYSLLSVLTVHFTELSLLPTALGVKVFLLGVGYVSGPPLAALIVDSGGTYQHSFIFLGSMMLLGSFLDMAAAVVFTSRDQNDDVEIVSVNRDWLGSSLVISVQETGCAHAHCDVGSTLSVGSRCSQNEKA